MKVTIDERACFKHKLTIQEALLALAVRQGKLEDVLENMVKRELIVKDNGDYLITQHWSEVLDEAVCDSAQECQKSDEELLELAKELRALFPAGKQKDRYGRDTPYYYRCNNAEIVKKLKKFFTLFGNFSNEEILDATRRYVASFNGSYWQKGILRLAKYFILKDQVKQGEEGNHVEQVSDLLTFLENKESEENKITESWTTKMI